jgi:hypothetical protein
MLRETFQAHTIITVIIILKVSWTQELLVDIKITSNLLELRIYGSGSSSAS